MPDIKFKKTIGDENAERKAAAQHRARQQAHLRRNQERCSAFIDSNRSQVVRRDGETDESFEKRICGTNRQATNSVSRASPTNGVAGKIADQLVEDCRDRIAYNERQIKRCEENIKRSQEDMEELAESNEKLRSRIEYLTDIQRTLVDDTGNNE